MEIKRENKRLQNRLFFNFVKLNYTTLKRIAWPDTTPCCLNTILNYTTLKLIFANISRKFGLNTILNYTTLKLSEAVNTQDFRLNTILNYTTLKPQILRKTPLHCAV